MTNLVLTPDSFANHATSIISKEFLSSVAKFEGYSDKPYKCDSGVLTIGFGHTHGVTHDMVLPPHAAKTLLCDDLSKVYNILIGIFSFFPSLPECYRNMLIDLAFNCGTSYFAKSSTDLHRSLLNVCLSFKGYSNITSEVSDCLLTTVLRYSHSKGRFLSGLHNRRFYFVKQCILWHAQNGYLESSPTF